MKRDPQILIAGIARVLSATRPQPNVNCVRGGDLEKAGRYGTGGGGRSRDRDDATQRGFSAAATVLETLGLSSHAPAETHTRWAVGAASH